MFYIVQFITLYIICVYYIYILTLFITGHTGRVKWRDDIKNVWLISPTIEQCEEVVSRLIKKQQTKGSRWCINLRSSSPESALVIISNLSKCAVRTLDIHSTPLDSVCMSTLSTELQTTNKTMIDLELELINCNITDNGVRYIYEGLTKNKTLTELDIRYNPQITSVSTSIIVELINTTQTLTVLSLHGTSLNNDDIKTICTTLVENTTIQELWLFEQHEEYCMKLDNYHVIKDRLKFLPDIK